MKIVLFLAQTANNWLPSDWTTLWMPTWATGDMAKVVYMGMFLGGMMRVFRAQIRWFKRMGNDTDRQSGD